MFVLSSNFTDTGRKQATSLGAIALILSLPSTFPLEGLLETTQSTEAASVLRPIPAPHQTSGAPTQLEDNASESEDDEDCSGVLMAVGFPGMGS